MQEKGVLSVPWAEEKRSLNGMKMHSWTWGMECVCINPFIPHCFERTLTSWDFCNHFNYIFTPPFFKALKTEYMVLHSPFYLHDNAMRQVMLRERVTGPGWASWPSQLYADWTNISMISVWENRTGSFWGTDWEVFRWLPAYSLQRIVRGRLCPWMAILESRPGKRSLEFRVPEFRGFSWEKLKVEFPSSRIRSSWSI